MPKNIQKLLARRARGKQPSPIRDLMRFLPIEGMISLGGGYPNPATFMFEEIKISFKGGQAATISGEALTRATQYGPSEIYPELTKNLLGWHQFKDGCTLKKSQVVTLNGSQEGLYIMAYLFLEADDWVVLSEPSYPGAISAFSSFCKNFLSVPLDQDGMQTGQLAQKLENHLSKGLKLPKFIYTISNGHNPGGVALSLKRRRQLIKIAQDFDLLILEDDPYQLLKLEDAPLLPTLQSLDPDNRVIRLDSFSKIFAPGLRFGYASGAPEIIQQFVFFKQSSNLHTSSFIQTILNSYLESFGFAAFRQQIQANCQIYRTHRDAMIRAVSEFLPDSVKYNKPTEGMFIWFELPKECNAQRMIDQHTTELKVLLVPGPAFSTQNGLSNYMRASFSLVPPALITEGIQRFGKMLQIELV